jgi:hypothetical protein
MPTSTSRYRFEYRLHDWAEKYVLTLAGHRTAYFVGMREDGTIRRVYVAPQGDPFDGATKAQLAEAHPKWFLYVPYDEDGSAYIEWLGLERRTVERWLGRRLEAIDFMDVRTTGTREDWPESWRVIIA